MTKRTVGDTPPDDRVVLVVEDSAEMRLVVAELLDDEGVRVLQAGDGLEVLDVARAAQADLILMDLSLSELDGLQASRQLTMEPGTRPIPIIALTGRPVDSPDVVTAGVSGAVRKQRLAEALVELVGAVLARAEAKSVKPP
jgi:CheY-like chemotaxis protein